jgi:hypothetical protein
VAAVVVAIHRRVAAVVVAVVVAIHRWVAVVVVVAAS